MTCHQLLAQMWLPLPINDVFGFFADANNLQAITPPWVQFKVASPQPIVLERGAVIDYQLRIRGIPVRWQSEITIWTPPCQFVDEQRRGPYKIWKHRHEFATQDGGTLVRDHVEYRARGWICEPLVHRWLVAPDLQAIFKYRQQRIRELLAPNTDGTADQVELR